MWDHVVPVKGKHQEPIFHLNSRHFLYDIILLCIIDEIVIWYSQNMFWPIDSDIVSFLCSNYFIFAHLDPRGHYCLSYKVAHLEVMEIDKLNLVHILIRNGMQ